MAIGGVAIRMALVYREELASTRRGADATARAVALLASPTDLAALASDPPATITASGTRTSSSSTTTTTGTTTGTTTTSTKEESGGILHGVLRAGLQHAGSLLQMLPRVCQTNSHG